jgi:hypothetical protein
MTSIKTEISTEVTDSEIVIDNNDDIHKNRNLQEMLLILRSRLMIMMISIKIEIFQRSY